MSQNQTHLSVSYRQSSQNPQILNVMTTISPITSTTREPMDICCVIDVSGSMGSSASAAGVEDAGLTVLDIVKHAVRTVFSCMNENDRLSLVSYSNNATLELPLINMDQSGKDSAAQVLERLSPSGSTNIWDGLLVGMESFSQQVASTSRNTALFLLTDGAPNIIPPKGHLTSMKDYKDSHGGVYPATISTFGFGYSLKSQLLNEIALEGGGSYSFIPDSGFVGTIFVNALANQMNSFAKHAALSLELCNGAKLVPNSADATCSIVTPTSWGALLSIGNLPYNQRRDFIFSVNIENWTHSDVFLEATLEFEPFTSDEKVTVACQNDGAPVTGVEGLFLEVNLFRSTLIERMSIPSIDGENDAKPKEKFGSKILKKFLGGDESITMQLPYREVGQPDQLSLNLIEEMKSWRDSLESRPVPSTETKPLFDYVNGLTLDLNGEINMAFEDRANYDKWGRHYIPSIRRAHQLQQCNNFKDPGVQFYGGNLFCTLRDLAEDTFCTLPAPTPSRRAERLGMHTATTYAAPTYDMSAYMNAAAGCIGGDSKILLADGSHKVIKDIQKGDRLRCNLVFQNPNSVVYEATVECVVKTRCPRATQLMRYDTGLLITPWHPVYQEQSDGNYKWVFPFDSGNKLEVLREEYVYNLVLGKATRIQDGQLTQLGHRGQSYIADSIECISLAHGIFDDEVAQHHFYGTELVVKSLKSLVGEGAYEEHGVVSMDSSQVVRDPESGLVCSYSAI